MTNFDFIFMLVIVALTLVMPMNFIIRRIIGKPYIDERTQRGLNINNRR